MHFKFKILKPMKKNYLTTNHKKAKNLSLKQSVLSLFLMLSMSFAFAQETAIIETTSNDSNWSAVFQNIGGLSLEWTAVGPGGINLSGTGDTPIFDFSPNIGNGIITITITILIIISSYLRPRMAGFSPTRLFRLSS